MEIIKQENQGIADIHTHTRCSGFGKYSFLHFPESITEPAKAVEAARRKKLDILCITDHNTIKDAIISLQHNQRLRRQQPRFQALSKQTAQARYSP
jgi:hypothetical protein